MTEDRDLNYDKYVRKTYRIDNFLLFTCDRSILLFDIFSGRLIQKLNVDDELSEIKTADGYIFALGIRGIYKMNINSGGIKVIDIMLEGSYVINYDIYDGSLFVLTEHAKNAYTRYSIAKICIEDTIIKWEHELYAPVRAVMRGFSFLNDRVFWGTQDALYCHSMTTGDIEWNIKHGNVADKLIISPPICSDRYVFCILAQGIDVYGSDGSPIGSYKFTLTTLFSRQLGTHTTDADHRVYIYGGDKILIME